MISIVTSAYNASSTISKAIESLQSQSFKDWEMIIVNDCSTDNTSEIVQSYVSKDARIRLIQHDINKGAGLARRTGISNIKGEWMTFLDSDDYLKSDCLETLHYYATNYDVDMISPGYIAIEPNGNIIKERKPNKCVIQVDGAKFKPNEEDTKRFMNPMLIKSSIWDKVKYSSRRFIEDTPTLVQVLYWARNIMLIDYAGYYYVQNPTSLIHTASLSKHCIYTALCAKDNMMFFINNDLRYASPVGFLNRYYDVLEVITDEDRQIYHTELKELEDTYNRIKIEKHG